LRGAARLDDRFGFLTKGLRVISEFQRAVFSPSEIGLKVSRQKASKTDNLFCGVAAGCRLLQSQNRMVRVGVRFYLSHYLLRQSAMFCDFVRSIGSAQARDLSSPGRFRWLKAME
jgi:hypothetical protein